MCLKIRGASNLTAATTKSDCDRRAISFTDGSSLVISSYSFGVNPTTILAPSTAASYHACSISSVRFSPALCTARRRPPGSFPANTQARQLPQLPCSHLRVGRACRGSADWSVHSRLGFRPSFLAGSL